MVGLSLVGKDGATNVAELKVVRTRKNEDDGSEKNRMLEARNRRSPCTMRSVSTPPLTSAFLRVTNGRIATHFEKIF